ncbi:hypothetical protein GGI35DRAFT_430419 [Trichoderma velutinum]
MTISHHDAFVCLLILPLDAVSSAIESGWHCLYRKYASHPTLSLSSLGKAWIRIQDEEGSWNSNSRRTGHWGNRFSAQWKKKHPTPCGGFSPSRRGVRSSYPQFSVPYRDVDQVCHGNLIDQRLLFWISISSWCTRNLHSPPAGWNKQDIVFVS